MRVGKKNSSQQKIGAHRTFSGGAEVDWPNLSLALL